MPLLKKRHRRHPLTDAERKEKDAASAERSAWLMRCFQQHRDEEKSVLREIGISIDGINESVVSKIVDQEIHDATGLTVDEIGSRTPGEALEHLEALRLRRAGTGVKAKRDGGARTTNFEYGVTIDDNYKVFREGFAKPVPLPPVLWSIFIVAINGAPSQFTMEKIEKEYPGTYSREAYDNAQSRLNNLLKKIGLVIKRRQLKPIAKS